ncbi:tyrosine-type recombinase/integrase [Aquisalimonas asiatica]|uniref:Phage integrase family protein n=1 Tax=Aquisalimonas asiatica TaxID=406100 RepID=A0A1H8UWB9_9GAMM|nr:tyrosine-type recombinase/integrase [Aquisalimonas asiatica]SEP07502.1 Phage integrase family protein [Aquisalimonas asiatica]
MDSAGLKENFQTGLFEGEDGRCFLRCEFNPAEPIWIDVTDESWRAVYAGKSHELNWAEVGLPVELTFSLKQVMRERMKRRAPSYLSRVDLTLKSWGQAAAAVKSDLSNGLGVISTLTWLNMWEKMRPDVRSIFRSLYQELADRRLAGADYSLAKEMSRWKARSDVRQLRHVTTWDVESGSFTSSEWELIREALNREELNESDMDCATRIFARILNETLKRPQQVLSMKKDSLWIAPSGREFFLRIPKAKGQAAEMPVSWQITETLARAIQDYSERPQILSLQQRFDRLIVMPGASGEGLGWMTYRQVDVAFAKARLHSWAQRQGIISHRTDRSINLTPYRIRHTGATSMALQGVPRDQIQEVLEHDGPTSADAYIQAVGSDLMPALERATDRGVGKLFAELCNSYFFKGAVVDQVERRPIHIPIIADEVAQPAVVGACGKDGACTEHPFWACYNGCPHFLAWRDAPHREALAYVESELGRWSEAEGGRERSKLGKDFDRVGAAIHEVIRQVEESHAHEVGQ